MRASVNFSSAVNLSTTARFFATRRQNIVKNRCGDESGGLNLWCVKGIRRSPVYGQRVVTVDSSIILASRARPTKYTLYTLSRHGTTTFHRFHVQGKAPLSRYSGFDDDCSRWAWKIIFGLCTLPMAKNEEKCSTRHFQKITISLAFFFFFVVLENPCFWYFCVLNLFSMKCSIFE